MPPKKKDRAARKKGRRFQINRDVFDASPLRSSKHIDEIAAEVGTSTHNLNVILRKGTSSLDQLDSLAKALGLQRGTDLLDERTPWLYSHVFDMDYVRGLEAALPPQGGIAVIASAPYLETQVSALLDLMIQRLQAGLSLTYFYALPDTTDIHTLVRSQRSEMLRSVATVFAALRPHDKHNKLKGYFFHNDRALLITNHTILICLSNDVTHPIPDHIFQYTLSSDYLDVNTYTTWLRIHAGPHRQQYAILWEHLRSHSEPIPWVGLYENTLESEVQADYRSIMDDSCFISIYSRLRKHIASKSSPNGQLYDVISVASVESNAERDFTSPPLAILDIGIGDGEVGVHAVARLVKDLPLLENAHIIWTAVDPARPSQLRAIEAYLRRDEAQQILQQQQRLLADLDFLRRYENLHVQFLKTPFEDYLPGDAQYDVILMMHSMYLLDCSYLKKALLLLRDNGILAILIAPLECNWLNQICCEVDKQVARKTASPKQAAHKQIGEDGFRNYAEDLHRYFYEVFDFEPETIRLTTDVDSAIGREIGDEEIRLAVEFFRGRLDLGDFESVVAAAKNRMRRSTNAMPTTTVETLILVRKQLLCEKLRLWSTGQKWSANHGKLKEPHKSR